MSRLESFIRRMQAQKACLDWAIGQVADREGTIVELGLGNGRTYDHLREHLPGRDILVFERKLAAHPGSIPPDHLLFMGELVDTLPGAVERFGGTAVLVHYDLGTGDPKRNEALALALSPGLQALMAPGGLLIADHPLPGDGWEGLPTPPGVPEGRYYVYRAP